MKVFKPLPLSLLSRCFEVRNRTWMGVSGLLMVSLGAQRKLWLEKDLWQFWATRPDAGWPLEDGMPRARSEYIVCGHAYPDDAERRACAVRAQVGALRKELHVHGARFWNGDRPTPAQPFERMPLDWAHTWGGASWPENPLGMGMADQDVGGAKLRPLAHIEWPDHPRTTPTAEGKAAGFGPIDGMWPQRASKRGTYDDQWLKTDFPGIAADANWTTFNIASDDQQQHAPFNGDEPYAFDNLHPAQPHLAGALPGLRTRLFVTQKVDGQEKFKEVASSLRALWFFPDEERAILVFQGMHEIAEDDGADIVHLMGGIEPLGQPRPASHYLDVRDKRLDKDNGALEAMREEDLMPLELVVPLIDFTPMENRGADRSRARGRREREAARADVASHGLDPDEHAAPLDGPPPPRVESIDDLIGLRKLATDQMAALKQKNAVENKKAIAEVKATFAANKMDFSPIEREMAGLETRGPPKPFVDDVVKDFHKLIARGKATGGDVGELEEMVDDKKLLAQWRGGEAGALQAYRMTAHRRLPVDPLAGDASMVLRRKVLAHHAAGGSFSGWDLTGANLSGMDLRGADFTHALMERANLTGADLADARLAGAMLAHAALVSTSLPRAGLEGANLGAARIERADFAGADLRAVIFEKATLNDVSWRGARLDGIRLHDAVLAGVDCSGAVADDMLVFLQRDLRGCNFSGVRFTQATFLECDLRGGDFSDAVIEKCAFVSVIADGANFQRMRIASGAFAQACMLQEADFAGATLRDMNFRGAALKGAVFREAVLQGSDFSECDLTGADFAAADLRGARFVRANLARARFASCNLMDSVFQHASLEDTDYRHANLFQSDFARVRLGGHVQLDQALTTRLRTLPRHRPREAMQ
ncbi:DUF2169 domain-containing protein [Variovorax paradoxus]|nr:DUF2169 domain-containing protein [Variovorax paradoxus]